MFLIRTLSLAALLGWPPGQLLADSYRCGRKLIRTGDSAADVLRVCGQPEYKDSGQEELWFQGRRQRLSVKRWYYRKSRRSLQHVVLLHRGKVLAVEVTGR